MKVNEVKETREVVVRTEYIANDGKIFDNIEECEKYEKTCRCVVMTDYKKLVKGRIAEYDLLYECGSEEFYYDIVEIKNEQERAAVNKALILVCSEDKLIEKYGVYLIGIDYTGEIVGFYTTIEEILRGIKDAYDKVLENKTEE